MTGVAALQTDSVSANYDAETRLMTITYRGALTPHVTAQAYGWINEALNHIEVLDGAIFDFSGVTQFESSNLSSAQRQSQTLNTKHDLSQIPAALIVTNPYQERLMQVSLNMTPQQGRKRIVHTMEEAQAFLSQFNSSKSDESSIEFLNRDAFSCRYEVETHLIHVKYYGVLAPEVTTEVYSWLYKLIDVYGIKTIRGGIFDFRQVTQFHSSNLNTVQRSSGKLNTNYDMSHIPVALLVRDYHQEQMVRVAMKVTPQEERKRIVKSTEEAVEFIKEFNQRFENSVKE